MLARGRHRQNENQNRDRCQRDVPSDHDAPAFVSILPKHGADVNRNPSDDRPAAVPDLEAGGQLILCGDEAVKHRFPGGPAGGAIDRPPTPEGHQDRRAEQRVGQIQGRTIPAARSRPRRRRRAVAAGCGMGPAAFRRALAVTSRAEIPFPASARVRGLALAVFTGHGIASGRPLRVGASWHRSRPSWGSRLIRCRRSSGTAPPAPAF